MKTLWDYVWSMRPHQWTKNLLMFLPLLFTVNLEWTFRDLGRAWELFQNTGIAFLYFCLLSGGLYLLNDLVDFERDRAHPAKCNRPIASGRISREVAGAIGAGLVGGMIYPAFQVDTQFGWIISGYVLIQFAYNLGLKHVVLLDVGVVASGFVLRVLAGAVVIGVLVSPWLYICSGLGALFLALAKRRSELAVAGEDAGRQRDSLRTYTLPMLDQMIGIVATSALVSYALYTFSAEGLPGNHTMMLTIPFVAYGLLRYLYLVHTRDAGESPETVAVTDIPMVITIVLWLLTSAATLHLGR